MKRLSYTVHLEPADEGRVHSDRAGTSVLCYRGGHLRGSTSDGQGGDRRLPRSAEEARKAHPRKRKSLANRSFHGSSSTNPRRHELPADSYGAGSHLGLERAGFVESTSEAAISFSARRAPAADMHTATTSNPCGQSRPRNSCSESPACVRIALSVPRVGPAHASESSHPDHARAATCRGGYRADAPRRTQRVSTQPRPSAVSALEDGSCRDRCRHLYSEVDGNVDGNGLAAVLRDRPSSRSQNGEPAFDRLAGHRQGMLVTLTPRHAARKGGHRDGEATLVFWLEMNCVGELPHGKQCTNVLARRYQRRAARASLPPHRREGEGTVGFP